MVKNQEKLPSTSFSNTRKDSSFSKPSSMKRLRGHRCPHPTALVCFDDDVAIEMLRFLWSRPV